MGIDPQIRELLRERLTKGDAYQVPTSEAHYQTRQQLPPGVLAAVAGAMASDNWEEIRFETPTRTPTTKGDVAVPVLQALISGAMAGAAVAVAGAALVIQSGAPWYLPMLAAVCVGVAVAGWAWSRLLLDHRQLLRTVQTITRRDDADPEPMPQADRLTVEVHERNDAGGAAWSLADLPTDRATLARVCRAVAGGVKHLSSRDLATMPGLSRDKARELLAALEERGFVSYANGRNHPDGAQWTARGRALSRGLTE